MTDCMENEKAHAVMMHSHGVSRFCRKLLLRLRSCYLAGANTARIMLLLAVLEGVWDTKSSAASCMSYAGGIA
jgi:hypothetical protein